MMGRGTAHSSMVQQKRKWFVLSSLLWGSGTTNTRASGVSLLALQVVPSQAASALVRSTAAFAMTHRARPSSSALQTASFTNDAQAIESNSHPVQQLLWLPHEEGTHNSVKITVPDRQQQQLPGDDNDPYDESTFRERLVATIQISRELKKASLWIEVPMSRARLIELMSDIGLRFHHAQGETVNLMVWLLEDTECKIPEYATHQVGVGAMVVNSRNEILCVRELRKNYMPWKVPGGLSELGENIDEAIIREVMEETGISCKFLSVISFRHAHNLQFGRSDLYFMCRLEPIEEIDENGNAIIPKPIPQVGEIEKAEWIPLQDYKDMISGDNGHPMMSHIVDIFEQSADIHRTVISSIVPGRRPAPIYHSALVSKGTADSV
jgi:ADP-ribose pyrophosphatase YjhB (NUDIX family)